MNVQQWGCAHYKKYSPHFLVIIIIVVQVEAVKIYVTTVEPLRKNERGGQNSMKLSLPQKNDATSPPVQG